MHLLSQRPQDRNQLNLAEYYYFTEYSAVKNNPNRSSIRKTDYEFGFKQQVADFAAVTLSAFYQETRKSIQLRKIQYAFLSITLLYDNIDFRSAKGFRLLIHLRRHQNFQFNANYTLQFVEGTGSDDHAQQYRISNNQPNFRSVYPVSTDARHQDQSSHSIIVLIASNITGSNKCATTKYSADFGINLGLNLRSGTPVRRALQWLMRLQYQVPQAARRRSLCLAVCHGTLVSTCASIRTSHSRSDKKSDTKEAREMGLSVYVYIQNLLNTENVLSVYPYTLNANDVWLSECIRQCVAIQLCNQSSIYNDLYRAKVNNPDRLQPT
jgi:hypothetical protein